MSPPPDFALFLGRLHVVLVHAPIALLALLALLECFAHSPRFRHANANTGIILCVTVPLALLTVLCGWLLSLSGGYDAGLLRWHKWTGIATVALFLLASLLYRLDRKRPYRLCIFSSVLVMGLAGHLGGSLTHGRDYLVRYAPGPFRAWLAPASRTSPTPTPPTTPADIPVFAGLVQPVVHQHCVPCHGPEKAKAGLRLDSFEAMLKGSETGPAIVPGKPADSLVLQRVQLPLNHDDHMPPEGKPQPSPDDIVLLRWWVDAGAPTNQTVTQLQLPPKISRIVEAKLGRLSLTPARPTAPPPLPLDDVLPLASSLADELNVLLAPISQEEPWLECNASIAGTNFTDAQLARLAPLRTNLRWLDLGGTAVTDTGLAEVATLLNLTRLHLERTAIADDGLRALAPLAQLEYLNLYGTGVSDSGLEHLRQLPRLKQLYLWQTRITPPAATNFAHARLDADQIARWQEEIEQLNARIRNAHLVVDIGVLAVMPGSTNAQESPNTPVNSDRSGTVSPAR